jgi:hypothetical protein
MRRRKFALFDSVKYKCFHCDTEFTYAPWNGVPPINHSVMRKVKIAMLRSEIADRYVKCPALACSHAQQVHFFALFVGDDSE